MQQKQEQMLQNLLQKEQFKNCRSHRKLIGNKIGDKISSVSKTKSKEKEDERQEIYRPLEKRQQTIDYLRLF